MPKPAHSAAGGAMSAANQCLEPNAPTNRRAFVQKSVMMLATATAAVAVLPKPAAAQTETADIDALWRERNDLVAQARALSAERNRLEERLPSWARPGPKWLRYDGTAEGAISSWPAIQDLKPPRAADAYRDLRPDYGDILHWYEIDKVAMGADWASECQEKRITALKERVAAQSKLKSELGIPELARQEDRAVSATYETSDKIEALPFSLEKIAALALIQINFQCSSDSSLDQPDGELMVAESVLKEIRPQLRGEVAMAVDELLSDRTRPISELSFCV